MVMRLQQIVYAPFYALFIVGPTAMLIEIWMDSRRASAAKLRRPQLMPLSEMESEYLEVCESGSRVLRALR